ncbi:ribosomal protein S18-alanine N-acetyltransferase [Desulfonatronum thiodismutans]|uniref:ribosomal protein S18-alanine N-acetyltransferase n=1 Tax=Desulfonatronum thiodismutans TaxID=159290 RepID=UPI00068C1F0A|nr:ribosomal protein S18-alanine N-acetyltransferase [Desulfonatronum thiodismutans]
MFRVFLLSRDELPEAAALEADHFSAPWFPEQFQDGHDRGTCRVHGIRDGTMLIGYISCHVLPPEMEILNMAVRPGFRGRGLGRALVAAALKHGASLGIELCHLEVNETNGAAVHLYTTLGFTRIGRRRDYYRCPEGARDAILMQCDPRPHMPSIYALHENSPVAFKPGGDR